MKLERCGVGHQKYPFCESDPIHSHLNAFDLVWLSQSAWYFKDADMLAASFRAWFGSDAAETGWRYDSAFVNFVQSGYEPTAFWVRNDHYDVDVVVI